MEANSEGSKSSCRTVCKRNWPLRIGICAVLVVLFGWLLVSRSRATSRITEGARRMQCFNNLRQLSMELALYADDNHGKLPYATRWCDALKKSSNIHYRVFICPSDKTPGVLCSYVFNRKMSGKSWNTDTNVVVLFEVSGAGLNATGGAEMIGVNSPHKNDGCNVLFSGGHVEWISSSRLNSLKWIPTAK